MIPEYRLINHLLLLKSNYFFKREIKKKIGHLQAKAYRSTYNLVFNCNKNLMFMKIISTYIYFHNISYKECLQIVANFILLISALMPVFQSQEKNLDNYPTSKKNLLLIGCTGKIEKWFNDSLLEVTLPEFLLKKSKLKDKDLLQIKKLVHISGKMFFELNKSAVNAKTHYEFGSLLMLFYILDLETRQSLMLKDNTNLDLKSLFSYEVLFTNKLMILNKLVDSAMILEKTNFNLYIRIMNYSLLGNYE